MKKFCCILLCGLIAFNLSGCIDKDSFAWKNTEERIIMSLEKTYPENTFRIVKPYDEYDGKYYAVCEDEAGLQFKVHTIMYDNIYHFGCYDEYLVELLHKAHFVEKADEIAREHGYGLKYDEPNQSLVLEIDINNEVDCSDLAETIVEIRNAAPPLPKIENPDTTFSTGVEKYFSVPELYYMTYKFEKAESNFSKRGKAVISQKEEKAVVESRVTEEYEEAMMRLAGKTGIKAVGEYTVMEGWNEIESELNYWDIFVYAKNGTDNKEEYNNFTIEDREMLYTEEEYDQFWEDITETYSKEIERLDHATVKEKEGTTDQGYVLYTYVITEENNKVRTRYHIMNGNRYCFIEETNYDNSEECDRATLETVNSLFWYEE